MNKKIIIIIVGIIIVGATLFVITKNNRPIATQNQNNQVTENQDREEKQKAEKVEVFVFHSTHRCASCVTMGKYAGETINEYFQPELRNGKIEFREINVDLPENKELASKFKAVGSSLFINAISDGKDNITEDIKVWQLIFNEAQFKSYLKDKLNKLLGK
jgi:disulfide oxidoreductase YuzD